MHSRLSARPYETCRAGAKSRSMFLLLNKQRARVLIAELPTTSMACTLLAMEAHRLDLLMLREISTDSRDSSYRALPKTARRQRRRTCTSAVVNRAAWHNRHGRLHNACTHTHTEASTASLCSPQRPKSQIHHCIHILHQPQYSESHEHTSPLQNPSATATLTATRSAGFQPPTNPLSISHQLMRNQSAPTLPREQRTRHYQSTGWDKGEKAANPETDDAARQMPWRLHTIHLRDCFLKRMLKWLTEEDTQGDVSERENKARYLTEHNKGGSEESRPEFHKSQSTDSEQLAQ
jgi:hypothetical protein